MRFLFTLGGLLLAVHIVLPAQSPALQTRDQAYLIQPGDSIEVLYRYTPEFNAKALVQPDGQVTLPITGAVRIGGLAVEAARAAIVAKAGERLRDPDLTLLLTDFVKPSFTVAGQVAKPGRYDLRGTMTAIDAVAVSGGLTESSKHSQVILVRRLNDELADVRVLDLKRIMQPGNIQEDVRVQNGDLLIVPQNFVSKLERYIRWGTLYAGLGIFRR
jgi:polysaccharide export outer membrane protein